MTVDPTLVDPERPAPEEGAGRRRGLLLWLTLAVVALVALPATLVVASVLDEPDEPEELVVEIPAGTGDRIAAGEDVEILPEEVQLQVGDRILLRNDDDQVHTVGPMTVRPGESLLQVFGQAGRFEGNCTLIPSRKVVIVVT